MAVFESRSTPCLLAGELQICSNGCRKPWKNIHLPIFIALCLNSFDLLAFSLFLQIRASIAFHHKYPYKFQTAIYCSCGKAVIEKLPHLPIFDTWSMHRKSTICNWNCCSTGRQFNNPTTIFNARSHARKCCGTATKKVGLSPDIHHVVGHGLVGKWMSNHWGCTEPTRQPPRIVRPLTTYQISEDSKQFNSAFLHAFETITNAVVHRYTNAVVHRIVWAVTLTHLCCSWPGSWMNKPS